MLLGYIINKLVRKSYILYIRNDDIREAFTSFLHTGRNQRINKKTSDRSRDSYKFFSSKLVYQHN